MSDKLLTPRDFVDVPEKDMYATADYFQLFIEQMDRYRANAFGITSTTAIDTKMDVKDRYNGEILKTLSFVSSSYLGLNCHPEVLEATQKAMEKYGVGTCTSPIIGGRTDIHAELEQKIARLHGQEDAILYTSGYAANIGVLQLLLNKSDIAIVDMFVHASIFDGLLKTNVKMFKHNDMEYLEMVLKWTQGKYRNVAVIIDGVYSQDGDLPRLTELCGLAQKFGAYVIMDDAHGVGVLGQNGKGTASHFDVEDKVDVVTGTFSKAIGSSGGYAAGKKQLVKYLKHFSRSNTFSAAIPPIAVAAASKAIDLFTEDPRLIELLWENTRYIKNKLQECGFDIGHSESPITPVMIRDDLKTKMVARELLDNGIYIIPTTYPAVKLKDSRLRLNVSARHTREDLDYFCQTLTAINKKLNITGN